MSLIQQRDHMSSQQAFFNYVRTKIPDLPLSLGVSQETIDYFEKNYSQLESYLKLEEVQTYVKRHNRFPFNPCDHFAIKECCQQCLFSPCDKQQLRICELEKKLAQLLDTQPISDGDFVSTLSEIGLKEITDVRSKQYLPRANLMDISDLTIRMLTELLVVTVNELKKATGQVPQNVTKKCTDIVGKMKTTPSGRIPTTNQFFRLCDYKSTAGTSKPQTKYSSRKSPPRFDEL